MKSRIVSILTGAACVGVLWPLLAAAQDHGANSTPEDGRRSSVVQRPAIPLPTESPARSTDRIPAVYPQDFRTVDGTYNNPLHPLQGAAGGTLLRITPVHYGDASGDVPGGGDRPNARIVSSLTCAQSTNTPNHNQCTAFLWQWGQFVDHDIDETPITSPAEVLDIPVPAGDPFFDPQATGKATIGFDRSAYIMVDGVRQQRNNITSYIDASNVYGSDIARAMELRAHDGFGRLKTSAGDLLPFNVNHFPNAPTGDNPTLFLAGDVRCNEQAALTCMHTLFMREHNYWAVRLHNEDPSLTEDDLYNRARAIVGAEIQAITYREFLPALLGPDGLPEYKGYDPMIDATVANIFATAAYRVGHTLLSSPLKRIGRNGHVIPAGHLDLRNAFFNPKTVQETGIDPLLRGLAYEPSQQIDCSMIDDVRNFLFGDPGAGGFDLASLNIQRGRDHGLASYNEVRQAFGRPAATSFADISDDTTVQQTLQNTYGSVDKIDAWIGLLAEDHRPGTMVGETLFRILRDQFTRLRDGDRFWYQSYFSPSMVRLIERQTLSRIIRRNTGIGPELQENVFQIAHDCDQDFNGDRVVDVTDLLSLISAWGTCDNCPQDLTGDGVVDVADLMNLLSAWGGC